MPLKLSDIDQSKIIFTGKQSETLDQSSSSKPQGSFMERFLSIPTQFGVGVGSAIGRGGLGLAELGLKGAEFGARKIGAENTADFLKHASQKPDLIAREIYDKPFADKKDTASRKAGEFIGIGAQFMAPTSSILKGQQALQVLAKPLTSATQGVPVLGGLTRAGVGASARFVPEALGSGAVELARTGGDLESAKEAGILSGGGVTLMAGAGSLARATFWPELQSSVTRALGIQGKTTGGRILPEVQKKATGLGIIKKYAHETGFEPKNATFQSTIEAWNTTRKYIYSKYSAISGQAGDDIAFSVEPIVNKLKLITQGKRTSVYKNAAQEKINDLVSNFAINEGSGAPRFLKNNAKDIEIYLKDLYEEAGATLAGRSDKAHGTVAATVAAELRKMLDDAIEGASGPMYHQLRSEYSALKSIEDDLVRQFQKEARQVGGGLTDYVNIFNSGDIMAGVITAQPGLVGKGVAQGLIANTFRALKQTDRYLRRSFDLVDGKNAGPVSQRFFGSPVAGMLSENEMRFINQLNKTQPRLKKDK